MPREVNAGSFRFDLSVSHPQCNPETLTSELGVKPWISSKTHWRATIQRGIAGVDGLPAASIEGVKSLIDSNRTLLRGIVEGGGSLILTLSNATRPIGDSDSVPNFLLHIQFQPDFLASLSAALTTVSLEVWEPQTNTHSE
jgi:hypothetical protein